MIHAVNGLREVKFADTDRRIIFNKLFYNISNTVDSVSTAQLFINPNWWSDVVRYTENLCKIAISNNFEITGLTDIPLRSSTRSRKARMRLSHFGTGTV